MYKIAVVDDEAESAEKLRQCFSQYTEECGEAFNVVEFKNGLNFLDEYTADFDLVILDIDMPIMNGLQVAKVLRKIDPTVALMFVTVIAKYAINGYEVDALDYVLKPVNYHTFKPKIARALAHSNRRRQTYLTLPVSQGEIVVEISSLDWVEVLDHTIVYHTSRGDYKAYGTLQTAERLLPAKNFFKCNRSSIINLRNITRFDGTAVWLGEIRFPLGSTRKKAFIEAMNEYLSS